MLPFDFKSSLDDLTLEDYLYIYKTLDEDEYPMVEVQHRGRDGKITTKRERNNYPLPKEDRTEAHMLNLQQKVVKYLTNLPTKYLTEQLLVKFCMSQVTKTFETINQYLTVDVKCKYDEPNYGEWNFERWILTEQTLTKGKEINGEHKEGIYWILPLVYESDESLEDRYNYFLRELPLKESIVLYRRHIRNIEEIKKMHPFIYKSGGGSSGPNITKHFQVFGWLETLRSMVINGQPFGNYIETKKAPLFEVLEFLNVNSSYVASENADIKLKNRK